jgi:hypothetical protein
LIRPASDDHDPPPGPLFDPRLPRMIEMRNLNGFSPRLVVISRVMAGILQA